jgi:hypothetical protein
MPHATSALPQIQGLSDQFLENLEEFPPEFNEVLASISNFDGATQMPVLSSNALFGSQEGLYPEGIDTFGVFAKVELYEGSHGYRPAIQRPWTGRDDGR